jgi:hypothetical protein
MLQPGQELFRCNSSWGIRLAYILSKDGPRVILQRKNRRRVQSLGVQLFTNARTGSRLDYVS